MKLVSHVRSRDRSLVTKKEKSFHIQTFVTPNNNKYFNFFFNLQNQSFARLRLKGVHLVWQDFEREVYIERLQKFICCCYFRKTLLRLQCSSSMVMIVPGGPSIGDGNPVASISFRSMVLEKFREKKYFKLRIGMCQVVNFHNKDNYVFFSRKQEMWRKNVEKPSQCWLFRSQIPDRNSHGLISVRKN